MQQDNWQVIEDKKLDDAIQDRKLHRTPVQAPAEVETDVHSILELLRAQQLGLNWRLQQLEERPSEPLCCLIQ